MFVQTILQYLASHKRIVVPQLGAFIVKVPGEAVVFSELLRQDDGVLRGLLCAAGMGELEAAGAVDRFVFEVRHALQAGGEYVMPGFGILRGGPNETVVFAYDPGAASAVSETPEPETPELEMRPASCSAEDSSDGQKLSTSPKMKPEPYVKGLRYGKPEKTTNAYRYVDRAPRRRGIDKLVLAAIAASVLALATIAYVYIRDSRADEEADYTEQTLPTAEPAPETGGETSTQQP